MIKISVFLNTVLLGTAMFLWEHPRTVPVSTPAIPAVAASVEPETAPVTAVPTVLTPFHWSQLISTNGYRAFVANLRAAGCPESTVEDIVRGNVQRAFEWKREELHVEGSEPGPWSAQAQAQMVADFLGQASPGAQEIAAASPSPAEPPADSPLGRPVTPMQVPIQDIDPAALAALNLSDDQKQMIAEVQQTYSAALNGQKQAIANASPSSPPSQSSQEQAGDTMQNPQNAASLASPQQPQIGANAGQQEQAQMEAAANASLEAELGSDGYLGYTMAQEQTALENQLEAHPGWVMGNPQ